MLVAATPRNTEIAEWLYLTPRTVSHHLTAIDAKLDVGSRTEAAVLAVKHGLAGAARLPAPGFLRIPPPTPLLGSAKCVSRMRNSAHVR